MLRLARSASKPSCGVRNYNVGNRRRGVRIVNNSTRGSFSPAATVRTPTMQMYRSARQSLRSRRALPSRAISGALTRGHLVAYPLSLHIFETAMHLSTKVPANPDGEKPGPVARALHGLKEFVHHLKDGSVQLARNVRECKSLLAKTLQGQTLTRRERALLVRTTADLFRLVPFAIIVIIPFAEFALPIILKLFPNLLPSTFTSKSQEEANTHRQLQAKLEVIKFLHETQDELNKERLLHEAEFDTPEEREAFEKFLNKVKNGWKISRDEVLKYSKLLQEHFGIDNLNINQLRAMCKFFGLPTIGTEFLLRETLRMKIKSIYADDELIRNEGVESLTNLELEEACRERGIKLDKKEVKRDKLIALLTDWLELTSVKVPMYLQILLRAYIYHQPAVVHEAVKEEIEHEEAPQAPSTAETKAEAVKAEAEQPPPAQPAAQAGAPSAAKEQEPIAPSDVTDAIMPELLEVEAEVLKPSIKPKTISREPVSMLQAKIESMVSEVRESIEKERAATLGQAIAQSADHELTPEEKELAKKHHLSKNAFAFIKAVFDAFDLNDDLQLSPKELKACADKLGVKVPDEEIERIFTESEKNKDGLIDFPEFLDCIDKLRELADKLEQEKREKASAEADAAAAAAAASATATAATQNVSQQQPQAPEKEATSASNK